MLEFFKSYQNSIRVTLVTVIRDNPAIIMAHSEANSPKIRENMMARLEMAKPNFYNMRILIINQRDNEYEFRTS